MLQTNEPIEAIYEDGVFKPLAPVELPEGTRVRVEPEASSAGADEEVLQQLLADGAGPDDATRILDNFRLLWNSYDTLTDEQKQSLEQSRLDQEHFFDRQSHP
ncbi:MAG TPA: antitoxin family protein [Blastocatellia bacterium]|nr:antitoxin family protein [Blastocatellia bacterium]